MGKLTLVFLFLHREHERILRWQRDAVFGCCISDMNELEFIANLSCSIAHAGGRLLDHDRSDPGLPLWLGHGM